MLNRLKQSLAPRLRRLQRDLSDNAKTSYAQCGEDLILHHLFSAMGVSKVTYLDIGAHHPTYLSNTYFFYLRGGHGVCVEPDPALFKAFAIRRPRDVHLNCGVGIHTGKGTFYVMSTSTLNTFSKEDSERYVSYGQHRLVKTISINLETINSIMSSHVASPLSLLSLDVEGLDYPILQSFDFNLYRPLAFCLETLSYTEDKSERKLTEIVDLMHTNGYMTYADTYVNTIFVDQQAWKGRPC